jgi:eukaryotic-like serine/threonine-protein kinase
MSVLPAFGMTNMTVEVGRPRTLFGYDLIDFIGQGAGSSIYAVSDPISKQIFALKHVVRKTDKDVRFIEQLENEFNVGKHLTHPGLRRVIDFKSNKTILRKFVDAALVMELFDGNPLESHLPRDLIVIMDCFIATAQALASMHDSGYVHCDLKPNNIMLASNGEIKVIDLGQACPVGTVKARIQGTPDFISPEQVKCQPVSKATDVFNFGATLYWALTGQKVPTLFTIKKGENSFLVDGQIKAPHEINPTVPLPLSTFVMECVRTVAAKRPADMHEVLRRLEILRHAAARDRDAKPANGKYLH